jgi:O-antigen/teichoic acid export membrane protein
MLDFNQFACNGLKRMDMAQNMMLLHRGTVVVGTLVSLALSRTLESVLVGMAVGGVAGAVASNIYFFRTSTARAAWTGNSTEWRRILKQSVPTGFASVLGQFCVRIGPVLLAWAWTSQVVGEYSAAFRVFEITYIVPAAVMAISVPHLAEALKKGRAEFLGQLKHVFAVMMPVAVGWSLFLYFGSRLIVQTLFGVNFLNAVPVLKVFAVVSFVVFVNYIVTNVMVIIGRQKRHAINMLLTFLLGLCFFTLLVGKGAPGVAAALLLTEASVFVLTVRYLWVWWRSLSAG